MLEDSFWNSRLGLLIETEMTSGLRNLKYENKLSRSERALRLVWGAVWCCLFRPTPRWALHGWRRSLLRLFGATIGEGSKIAPSCRIWAPWNLVLGDFAALGDGVDCYNVGKIAIGSKAAVSQRSFLCAATHDASSLLRPLIVKPIAIQNHAWVAAESLIMPGVTIGEGAVIGARSVVTRDMPAWHICVGVPCRERAVREVTDLYLDPNIRQTPQESAD